MKLLILSIVQREDHTKESRRETAVCSLFSNIETGGYAPEDKPWRLHISLPQKIVLHYIALAVDDVVV